MPDFQAKTKSDPKKLYRRLVLALLVLIVIVLSKSVWDLYQKNKTSKQNRLVSESRLADLEGRQKMLEESIDRLNTQAGVEEEIRKNFNVVKDGERVITIVEEKNKEATTSTSTKMGFWQWLFH